LIKEDLMKLLIRFIASGLLLLPLICFAQGQYDVWLRNEGYYLLSEQEKEKFREMPDAQKEIYIKNLWASLDPDPITPENEYQKEYVKRVEYAKKYYRIPSDRAKIYILLGKPNSVETHHNSDKYFPLELWSYFSLGYPGLPPSLELIFFKRFGAGDFRLYSPLFDGMKSLTPSNMDFDNPRAQAQMKSFFDPQIVEASQRLSIGAGPNESEIIRATLQDPGAIRRIEKRRPTVETTVVYEGFEADVTTYSVPYRDQVLRTSIAISVPPKYVTFEKAENLYQGRIDLIGSIIDENKNEIVRINDSPPFKMQESEFEKAKAFHFCYNFDAYLLPGKYTLKTIFRDYVSNSAGSLERSFEVEAPSGELELLDPLIAYKASPVDAGEKPFLYGNQQYAPKENSTLSNNQALILYSKLLNPKRENIAGNWDLKFGLKKDNQNVLELSDTVVVQQKLDQDIARLFRLQSMVPGSYVAYIRISRPDITMESETPIRIVSSPEVLGRLRIQAESNNPPEAFHTNIALQYFLRNDLDAAARHARIATDLAPTSYIARGLTARIEKARGNTPLAISSYEKLIQESPGDSEGYYYIGKWSLEQKDAAKASGMLKKAMELGFYTTDLLNSLASAELQLGNKKGAVDYWEKSLALDSQQPEIEQLLAQHKQ
jgi:GWxTD domain-containing protein